MKNESMLQKIIGAGLGCIASAALVTPSFAQQAILQKLTWGNPDQKWGTRRPVTAADRKTIALYRSSKVQPIYSTDFTDQRQLGADWQSVSDDYLESCRRPENVVATAGGLQLRTAIAIDCKAKWSTGFIISKQHYGFGFYEATIKAGDIDGLNNAFWLVTEDHFEIDVCELHFPNIDRMTLHDNNKIDTSLPPAVGFDSRFSHYFHTEFHDVGVLWTPTDVIYEVDGLPVAAIHTNGAISGKTDIRFSTTLMDYAGKVPEHPEGHHMSVKSLRILPLR